MISSNKRGQQKKRVVVLEVVLPGREANDLLGERRVCLEGEGKGEPIQINYKINFIQDSF